MATTTVSTKGQVVLPAEIRKRAKLEAGTKLAIEETAFGIILVKIPKNPLAALYGAGKGLKIRSSDVRKLRDEDARLEARR